MKLYLAFSVIFLALMVDCTAGAQSILITTRSSPDEASPQTLDTVSSREELTYQYYMFGLRKYIASTLKKGGDKSENPYGLSDEGLRKIKRAKALLLAVQQAMAKSKRLREQVDTVLHLDKAEAAANADEKTDQGDKDSGQSASKSDAPAPAVEEETADTAQRSLDVPSKKKGSRRNSKSQVQARMSKHRSLPDGIISGDVTNDIGDGSKELRGNGLEEKSVADGDKEELIVASGQDQGQVDEVMAPSAGEPTGVVTPSTTSVIEGGEGSGSLDSAGKKRGRSSKHRKGRGKGRGRRRKHRKHHHRERVTPEPEPEAVEHPIEPDQVEAAEETLAQAEDKDSGVRPQSEEKKEKTDEDTEQMITTLLEKLSHENETSPDDGTKDKEAEIVSELSNSPAVGDTDKVSNEIDALNAQTASNVGESGEVATQPESKPLESLESNESGHQTPATIAFPPDDLESNHVVSENGSNGDKETDDVLEQEQSQSSLTEQSEIEPQAESSKGSEPEREVEVHTDDIDEETVSVPSAGSGLAPESSEDDKDPSANKSVDPNLVSLENLEHTDGVNSVSARQLSDSPGKNTKPRRRSSHGDGSKITASRRQMDSNDGKARRPSQDRSVSHRRMYGKGRYRGLRGFRGGLRYTYDAPDNDAKVSRSANRRAKNRRLAARSSPDRHRH